MTNYVFMYFFKCISFYAIWKMHILILQPTELNKVNTKCENRLLEVVCIIVLCSCGDCDVIFSFGSKVSVVSASSVGGTPARCGFSAVFAGCHCSCFAFCQVHSPSDTHQYIAFNRCSCLQCLMCMQHICLPGEIWVASPVTVVYPFYI